MKKFKVYIKSEYAHNFGYLENEIYGYSEKDALYRNGINESFVEDIFQIFI